MADPSFLPAVERLAILEALDQRFAQALNVLERALHTTAAWNPTMYHLHGRWSQMLSSGRAPRVKPSLGSHTVELREKFPHFFFFWERLTPRTRHFLLRAYSSLHNLENISRSDYSDICSDYAKAFEVEVGTQVFSAFIRYLYIDTNRRRENLEVMLETDLSRSDSRPFSEYVLGRRNLDLGSMRIILKLAKGARTKSSTLFKEFREFLS